jgi:hypothetical protein
VLSAALGGSATAICLQPNNPFQVLDFYFVMNPTDWNTILHDTTFTQERQAFFHCGDELPLTVSVRRKPTVALPNETNPVKVSLKVDINEFVAGQEWNSHRKFSLENGGGGNAELLREGIAWMLMARAGMITSGATWIRVHVNGTPIGIYTRVEQIDKAFLRRHLSDDPLIPEDNGFLYDEGVPKTRSGEVDPFAAAICYNPFDTTCPLPMNGYDDLHQDLDVIQLFTLGASNAFTLNAEGLLGKVDNHWWYNTADPRRYFAWDLDQILNAADPTADPHTYGPSGNSWQPSLLGDPNLLVLFDLILGRLISDPYHPDTINRLLDQLAPVIGPAIDADPWNNLTGSFATELETIRTWMLNRAASLTSQLPTYTPFPVVINEVMASNKSTIMDEGFEWADWVELHNTSASSVLLDGLYISDSPAFPRRFAFPSGTSIPAGGYLLVWCDNDFVQGPLHTGFKLEKDGEMVGLFASDADHNRALDFVWFDPQESDISIGRFPDGAPGLQTQSAPTPGTANAGTQPGGVPATMTVEHGTGSSLVLNWEASCSAAAQDYAIYEGEIGNWYSHTEIDCSDDLGDLAEEIIPLGGSRYYIIVPRGTLEEGSYGRDWTNAERPAGLSTCAPLQALGVCSP